MKHHEESIVNMIRHYREDPDIKALFLIGSVAVGDERPDSDVDGVAIIPQAAYEQRKAESKLEEVFYGKCTYEGGYFNIHYMTEKELANIAESGSEPMRNMFFRAKTLYCDIPSLPALVAKIPEYPKSEAASKQFRFYCNLKMHHTYHWKACKPQGYMRHHAADWMIFNLYRLILIENEILFPSVRKIEDYVIRAPKKPAGVVELCHRFMATLADDDCARLVELYESWTDYDYPKDHNIVMNNSTDPYEWNI